MTTLLRVLAVSILFLTTSSHAATDYSKQHRTISSHLQVAQRALDRYESTQSATYLARAEVAIDHANAVARAFPLANDDAASRLRKRIEQANERFVNLKNRFCIACTHEPTKVRRSNDGG